MDPRAIVRADFMLGFHEIGFALVLSDNTARVLIKSYKSVNIFLSHLLYYQMKSNCFSINYSPLPSVHFANINFVHVQMIQKKKTSQSAIERASKT